MTYDVNLASVRHRLSYLHQSPHIFIRNRDVAHPDQLHHLHECAELKPNKAKQCQSPNNAQVNRGCRPHPVSVTCRMRMEFAPVLRACSHVCRWYSIVSSRSLSDIHKSIAQLLLQAGMRGQRKLNLTTAIPLAY